jgi:hypothetical protein
MISDSLDEQWCSAISLINDAHHTLNQIYHNPNK